MTLSFMWQLGYCKAQHVFVPCDLTETHEDLAYILASYFPATSLEDQRPLKKRTRLKQHHRILALCNYRRCDAHARQRGEPLRGLYRLAQQVVPQLAISPESIKYYASLQYLRQLRKTEGGLREMNTAQAVIFRIK